MYLGGGTPSLLSPNSLAKLLETVDRSLRHRPGAEITLEANPDDVDAKRAASWRAAGVNRVSSACSRSSPWSCVGCIAPTPGSRCRRRSRRFARRESRISRWISSSDSRRSWSGTGRRTSRAHSRCRPTISRSTVSRSNLTRRSCTGSSGEKPGRRRSLALSSSSSPRMLGSPNLIRPLRGLQLRSSRIPCGP